VIEEFGVTGFNAVTYPCVDVARIRRELGAEIELRVIVDSDIVRRGPVENIFQTVRELLTDEVKAGGRLIIMTDDMMADGTPMGHGIALYEAVKGFGQY